MLTAYNPETEDEPCRAAEITSFGFHALEVLSEAAAPGLPLTRILNRRRCPVSLSRESHKAQRKLDQLQRDRRAGVLRRLEAAEPMPERAAAPIGRALSLIESNRQEQPVAPNTGGATSTQAHQHRQTGRRITENLRKNQAIHEAAAAESNRDCLRQGRAGWSAFRLTANSQRACLMTFPGFGEQWFTIGGLQPADGERGRIGIAPVG